MAIEIVFSDTAFNHLKRLDRVIAKRIFKGVSSLNSDYKKGVAKIANSPFYKLRIGDYYVIMDIKNGNLRILKIKRTHLKNS